MNKKATKKTARRTLASREDKESSSSGTSTPRGCKRKASPDTQTPRKRKRCCDSELPKKKEEDLRVRVLKRKIRDDGEGILPTKQTKRKKFDINQEDLESASTSECVVDTGSSSHIDSSSSENVRKRGKKRETEAGDERPNKRTKKVKENKEPKQEESKQEEPKQEEPKQENLSVDERRALFKSKYEEEDHLGAGGFGNVFAGYRKSDNLPVAIKHIPRNKVFGKQMDKNGTQSSIEIAVMSKLSSGSVGTSAAVSLLDWYDLKQELILVMERPVPSTDLLNHIDQNGGALKEEEAKIILKQLVDAAKELQDQNVFHRDIKAENILIETGSDVPRVRLIDFGLSCFVKKQTYFRLFCGTSAYIPPEWYSRCTYKPGPTTVWQLGAVLYDSLHKRMAFETNKYLGKRLRISTRLSLDCQDFLKMCLMRAPEKRLTLEQLQLHPWLR